MSKDAYWGLVGSGIRDRRKKLGLTLRQLSELTGIDHGNLSKLENGDGAVGVERLGRLAEALNLPLGILLDPSLLYIDVLGWITGAGKWVTTSTMFEADQIYPFVLPCSVDGAACAFEIEGQNGFAICARFSPSDPAPGAEYVIWRKTTLGVLAGDNSPPTDEEAAEPLFELGVRVFNPELAENVLRRPAGAGVPLENALSRAGANAAPGISSEETLPIVKKLRELYRPGWYEATGTDLSTVPMADRYIRLDHTLAGIWRIIGRFEVNDGSAIKVDV